MGRVQPYAERLFQLNIIKTTGESQEITFTIYAKTDGYTEITLKNFRIKIINTRSSSEKLCRLFCLQWEAIDASNAIYSNELSFGVEFLINHWCLGIYWKKEYFGKVWRIYLLPCVPVRIHIKRSWGGRFV